MTSVPLRWLEGAPPADFAGGVTFGVPFARGTVADAGSVQLTDSDGRVVPSQAWQTASWPDGSVKWAGVAVGAHTPTDHLQLNTHGAVEPDGGTGPRVRTIAGEGRIQISTGALTCTVGCSGRDFIRSISVDGREVASAGRLVSSIVDTVDESSTAVHRTSFESEVSDAVVESEGPVRTVVKITGKHSGAGRRWLPFTVRLYFYAGARNIRMMHTFVWDGDEHKDFLSSLGVRFEVPLRGELHDRHVRLAGADGGFLAEAVRGLTGLRRDPGTDVRHAQVQGRATPPLSLWNPEVSGRLDLIPAWPDYTLSQLGSDGFSIRKRTGPEFPWIDSAQGTRAAGYAYLGTPDGGFGVGLGGFWQSHPTGIDIRSANEDRATLTHWLHSPEARPMDLRFYHDGLAQDTYERQLEGLEITYEDYEEGFGTPFGVARTHELTLFAYEATPAIERLADDARWAQTPPLLQAEPGHLYSAGVFGNWSPVNRETPERAALEDKLDFLFDFYAGQVEERRWYGFWNYGDVMHTYDVDRHVWRYDVGGYAWDNSELSPDLWLWYSYLRSGRADIFRFAEAMTRHTGEVDVYHLGKWAGLGTRHNVQHWGCSAKQHRISSPAYRRFYYYLTADERTGDLLTELVDSDRTFLGLDPTRKVRPDIYQPNRNALAIGLGTDWGALAATWLTEWERTGNPVARDKLLGTMADIAALPNGFLTGEALYDLDTGRFDTTRERLSVSHLSAVFGLVEIASELVNLTGMPEFETAWLQYCRLFLASPAEQREEVGVELKGVYLTQAHSRLTAYAAARLGDPNLARRAWVEFAAGGELLGNDVAFHPHTILPPLTLQPVTEARTVSTNDASQFGLAAIQLLALVGDHAGHPVEAAAN